ncbi:dethiobiotin synthase [Paenibacillus albicereus]|uniref:ATP-dependent dethiobiotin synthetase BioD n=1 Tax=Paenibacillus albicereus TaxID=2726185 RepID=A0A6H2H0B5_9BACL|nr:dethiobiotin synthase [Paenibacillus albicereus]QJC53092.1 dethiobiotin synthase [Paenibacillus albicereus]
MNGGGYRGLFVTGTDTGIGKTVVTAALAALLRAEGADVGVWKPVQTGGLVGSGGTDAERLLRYAGIDGRPDSVASFTYEPPLAPLLAAERAGDALGVQTLLDAGRPLADRCAALLVEGAGGVAVPLAESAVVADLIAALRMPALIVARSGLGTINHVLLTAAYLRQRRIPIVGVVLNDGASAPDQLREDPSVDDNAALIERFGGIPVLGRFPGLAGELTARRLTDAARTSLVLDPIRKAVLHGVIEP